MKDKVQKAIDKVISEAIDNVCERTEWIDNTPQHTSKMKTSAARKATRVLWDEWLCFNEDISNELELQKSSDWLPECPKAQLEGYIAYLQGAVDNLDGEEIEMYYS